MAKKKGNEKIASVLAFEKKLVVSDGYMYGTTWDKRGNIASPIRVVEKAVRGTVSHSLPETTINDPIKMRSEVEVANLQVVDSAALSIEQDTLKLVYTLKILPGVQDPSACNNKLHQKQIHDIVLRYIEEFGFRELAKRYASNIATGRYLWRNILGAEKIETHVSVSNSERKWIFESTQMSLNDFDENYSDVKELAEIIARSLSGEQEAILLEIITYARIGNGQEVYPSQELVLNKDDKAKNGKNKENYKSKILYSTNEIAAMHSQKIGNAIRTIDTWYPDFEDNSCRPIAIETYGTVTNLSEVHRAGKDKKDFYTLFNQWTSRGDLDDENDKHYVMAVLVRGGVFGQSEKE